MKKLLLHFFAFSLLALVLLPQAYGQQDRFTQIAQKLQVLSADVPGLNQKVDLSVNGVSIQDFLRGIAVTDKLNISVSPDLKINVVNNFSNATVSDVLLFLCKTYNLDINFIGNIMSIKKYIPPKPKPKPVKIKTIHVQFNKNSNELSMDLKNDTLNKVAKAITIKSGKNIVLSPGTENQLVSVFIKNSPFDDALDKFAFANNLKVTKTKDNFYLIEKVSSNKAKNKGKNNNSHFVNTADNNNNKKYNLNVKDYAHIDLSANDANINDIIKDLFNKLHLNYFLISGDISGSSTVNLKNADLNTVLSNLFSGTDYTVRNDKNIYLIGKKKDENLEITKVIQLQHRTVDKVMDYIPSDLKKDVELKKFPDLNSLVATGAPLTITKLDHFIKQIDKVVPVVLIEVIIVDYKTTNNLSTGIKAGIGTKPADPTSGQVYPSANINMDAQSVNNLINSFNGFGLFNIGKVTPNFYLSLSALEERGIIKIRSTPKLATLNGHKATMSIGNTEYYLEQSNNVIGSQNPQNIITNQYKSVNADLTVNIEPMVSGDDEITLDVSVKQSTFTARISPDAPPGTVSRNFSSLIRVKNGEMVLLGGLEEKTNNDTGSGVPFLDRIPVLKWIFSSRTKEKTNSKLNIFIKPTVIY